MEALDGEIQVYRLDLSPPPDEAFRQGWLLLDGEERERAGRIRHAQTQQAFVQVRAALRLLLGRHLRQPPAAIRFALGGKGKPRLQGTAPDEGLVFNVSHSGECGLIALGQDTALGVDVERRRPMAHMDGMAERCFAPAELDGWQGLPQARREEAFFGYWCCKEAFVKATGEGIGLGLEACAVDLSQSPPRLLSVPSGCGRAEEWVLAEIDAGPDYGAALCYRGEPRRVRVADFAPFMTGALNLSGAA
jgi:4'-phosphopantetheinyl transferase